VTARPGDRRERIAEVHRLNALGGLTQRQIAKRVGCSQGSVSLWLRGIHSPWRCERCDATLRTPAGVCGLCAADAAAPESS
jgi:predicted transcriptional regulator